MSANPEVSVRGIGSGGLGIGTLPDGKVVFLPRTAPGDQVRIRLVTEKAKWARGEVVEWLKTGENRRDPPCPSYSRCDGCSLQHLSYESQMTIKGSLVGDALRRIGGMDLENPQVVPSPNEYSYRNRVTFTLRRLAGGGVVAGFRELGQQGRVLDIGPECLLPNVRLAETWTDLRASWGPGASLLPGGREVRITLRDSREGVALFLRGGRGHGDPEAILEAIPNLVSVWAEKPSQGNRLLAGEGKTIIEWDGRTLEAPGGGFTQVNPEAGKALYRYMLKEVGKLDGLTIVDAYCGLGLVGRSMARTGARVTGIDLDPVGSKVTSDREPSGFDFVVGRVEDLLPRYLPADTVLLNPPRGGLAETVPALLAKNPPAQVIYVSCDPATLARDLRRLKGAFQVDRIRAFDLFPQTAHIETVVTLSATDGRHPS